MKSSPAASFDVIVWGALGADGSVVPSQPGQILWLSITKACAGAVIVRQTSLAGGSGACYARGGEREGRSPLASKRKVL
jgi:hypothetical protein